MLFDERVTVSKQWKYWKGWKSDWNVLIVMQKKNMEINWMVLNKRMVIILKFDKF